MRLGGPWITDYATADGKRRWRVRWIVRPGDGTERNCQRRGFTTKGHAQAFVANLYDAAVGRSGWHLNNDGHPIRTEFTGPTIFTAVCDYVAATFPSHKANTRAKNASTLQWIVVTLSDDKASQVLAAALERYKPRQKVPVATTTAHHAIAYLRDVVLIGKPEPLLATLSDTEANGRALLASSSIRLAQLSEQDLARLRLRLVSGRTYNTGRSYWSVVIAFFNWCRRTGRMDRDPLLAFPKVPRNKAEERLHPDEVPSPEEVEEIAEWMATHHSVAEGTLVRLTAHCALRISEALDLRPNDFVLRNGRWWLRVIAQAQRTTKRFDWDRPEGRSPTKTNRVVNERRGPLVPIPAFLADHVVALLDAHKLGDDEPVFRGPRRRQLNTDTFRDSHWKAAIASLYPGQHRLAGITPHSLRHAGMTFWLRSGVDYKRCQIWGRWESVAVMLDVYAAALPSDEPAALALLDAHSYGGVPSRSTDAQLVDLGERRRLRRPI